MFESTTSCTARKHSSKELFEQLIHLLFGTSRILKNNTLYAAACYGFTPSLNFLPADQADPDLYHREGRLTEKGKEGNQCHLYIS
jgi:hypothetical protein